MAWLICEPLTNHLAGVYRHAWHIIYGGYDTATLKLIMAPMAPSDPGAHRRWGRLCWCSKEHSCVTTAAAHSQNAAHSEHSDSAAVTDVKET